MKRTANEPEELQQIYGRRFADDSGYRCQVWSVLCAAFFQRLVSDHAAVLDLGCGHGEFINQIRAGKKFGMDLNPSSPGHLRPDVTFLPQDCCRRWELPDASLDVVFTSNFFEHLPDKAALRQALLEARRCLKPGGRIIAMGPNIRFLPGAYWNFWDHHLPLSDLSLAEGLESNGYRIVRRVARFLPYTMVNAPRYPLPLLRLYLAVPLLWRIFGRQFLVVGERI